MHVNETNNVDIQLYQTLDQPTLKCTCLLPARSSLFPQRAITMFGLARRCSSLTQLLAVSNVFCVYAHRVVEVICCIGDKVQYSKLMVVNHKSLLQWCVSNTSPPSQTLSLSWILQRTDRCTHTYTHSHIHTNTNIIGKKSPCTIYRNMPTVFVCIICLFTINNETTDRGKIEPHIFHIQQFPY